MLQNKSRPYIKLEIRSIPLTPEEHQCYYRANSGDENRLRRSTTLQIQLIQVQW